MGVESTSRRVSAPEMDVRTTCITNRHIRPDKLSHGAAHLTHSSGGWLSWDADVWTKPFIDIVLQTGLYLLLDRGRFIHVWVRVFTQACVHAAATSLKRIAACKGFLSRGKIAHGRHSGYFTVGGMDKIILSDNRKNTVGSGLYQFPFCQGKVLDWVSNLLPSSLKLRFGDFFFFFFLSFFCHFWRTHVAADMRNSPS